MSQKWVWLFREGNGTMRDLLGGKGAGLAEMTNAGLPVPPGFTITTETCNEYYRNGKQFPAETIDQVHAALRDVEQATGKRFGDPANPLLVSVRSGSKFSMPGMMDTILNLGLNDVTVEGLATATGNPRFAYDSYRRFIQMYGGVVLEVDKHHFEHALAAQRRKAGVDSDPQLSAADLQEVIATYKGIIHHETGHDFPADPVAQLQGAIEAVFRSWNNDRAIVYRRRERISDDLGTGVNAAPVTYEVDGKQYAVLRYGDLCDFLAKKDYLQSWHSEMHERFCFWSYSDWVNALEEVGFVLAEGSGPKRNDWLIENRFAPAAKVFEKQKEGFVAKEPPITNVLLVAYKPV